MTIEDDYTDKLINEEDTDTTVIQDVFDRQVYNIVIAISRNFPDIMLPTHQKEVLASIKLADTAISRLQRKIEIIQEQEEKEDYVKM